MPATASHHLPPINIQWWRSRSVRPPSTVDPPVLPCPYQLHPTNQSCQACPSRPFLNQHTKCYEPYLPLQSILKPTCQSKRCEAVLSLLNRLPAPPRHFRTDTPSAVSQCHNYSTYYLPLKTILNWHAKRCEQAPSFLIILADPPRNFWTDTAIFVSQSRHSSSDSSFINDSYGIKQFFSASVNAYYAALFSSCW